MDATNALNIDTVASFDPERSLLLIDARKLLTGRRGRPSIDTMRRWANPRVGYLPWGPDGPRLVLPTVRFNGEVRTMAEWCQAFEAARIKFGAMPRPEKVAAQEMARQSRGNPEGDKRRALAQLATLLGPNQQHRSG